MSEVEWFVAAVAGIIQGIFEWLPISSQGNLAVFLTAVGTDPEVALQLALFLQVGTTISAATYYREEIAIAFRTLPNWRPDAAYEEENALASYIVLASFCTGLVGIPLYIFAVDLASSLTGGAFVAIIGILLVLTGILQLRSESMGMGDKSIPTFFDSILVGAFQGFAILPGISRSGVTSSVLLVRSYDPPEAFRLSFLLSIPASLGAAALTMVGAGGLPGINPVPAVIALLVSAVVGYLTIDAIMRVVDRIPFWQVCFGLGGLAILGGGLAIYLG